MDYHSLVCYNFLFSDVAPGLRCVRRSLWPLAAVYLVRLIIKCAETVVQLQTECTVLVLRMAHRKWKETKQQPSMLPGPAVPGFCLVSFHILLAILSKSTVDEQVFCGRSFFCSNRKHDSVASSLDGLVHQNGDCNLGCWCSNLATGSDGGPHKIIYQLALLDTCISARL